DANAGVAPAGRAALRSDDPRSIPEGEVIAIATGGDELRDGGEIAAIEDEFSAGQIQFLPRRQVKVAADPQGARARFDDIVLDIDAGGCDDGSRAADASAGPGQERIAREGAAGANVDRAGIAQSPRSGKRPSADDVERPLVVGQRVDRNKQGARPVEGD